jgi:hypothetical protein
MIPESFKVLSEQLWMSGFVIALVDVIFVLLLTWRVKSSRFRELKWTLVGTAAIFWGAFATVLVVVFWDTYYHYFFPGWLRSGGILLYAPTLYGAFALTFHWLALRLPGNPIVNFCLLSGLESLLEHLWGIYGLKILRVPILQEASPESILAVAFPEYILYWCIVISIAVLFQKGWRWWVDLRRTGASVA